MSIRNSSLCLEKVNSQRFVADYCTGKYHNNILEGAVEEDNSLLSSDEGGPEVTDKDLEALATA